MTEITSSNENEDVSKARARRLWVPVLVVLGVDAMLGVVAMVGQGVVVHACGAAMFVGAILFYRSYVRLADHYEGETRRRNSFGHILVLVLLLMVAGWFVFDWYRARPADLRGAKTLVFLCLFVHVWQMMDLVFQLTKDSEFRDRY